MLVTFIMSVYGLSLQILNIQESFILDICLHVLFKCHILQRVGLFLVAFPWSLDREVFLRRSCLSMELLVDVLAPHNDKEVMEC